MPINEQTRNKILSLSPEGQRRAATIIANKQRAAEARQPGLLRSFGQGLSSIGREIKTGYQKRYNKGFSDFRVSGKTNKATKVGLGLMGAFEGFSNKTGFTDSLKKFDTEARKRNPKNTFRGNLGTGLSVGWNALKGMPERAINTVRTGQGVAEKLFRDDAGDVIEDLERARFKKKNESFFFGDELDPIENAGKFIGGEAITAAAAGGLGSMAKGGRVSRALAIAGSEGALEFMGTESKEAALTAAILAGAGGFFGKTPIAAGKNITKKMAGETLAKIEGKTGLKGLAKKSGVKSAAGEVLEGSPLPKLDSKGVPLKTAKELEIPTFKRNQAKYDLQKLSKTFDERVGRLNGETLALPSPKKAKADFVGTESGKIFNLKETSADLTSRVKNRIEAEVPKLENRIKSLTKKGAKRTIEETAELSSLSSRLKNTKKAFLDEAGLAKLGAKAERFFDDIASGKPVQSLNARQFFKAIDLLDGKVDIPGKSANFTKRVSKFLSQPDAKRVQDILSGKTQLNPEQAIGELNEIINGAAIKADRFGELDQAFRQDGYLDEGSSNELQTLQKEALDGDTPTDAIVARETKEFIETPYTQLTSKQIEEIPEKILKNPESIEEINKQYLTDDPFAVPTAKRNAEIMDEAISVESPTFARRAVNALRNTGNYYVYTSASALRSLDELVYKALHNRYSSYLDTHTTIRYDLLTIKNKLKKVPKLAQKQAIEAIEKGSPEGLTGKALDAYNINKELAEKSGKIIIDNKIQRLDGGIVQLRDNFAPVVSANYAKLKGTKKAAFIKETALLNNMTEGQAKTLLDKDFSFKQGQDNVFFSGSLAYRRVYDDIKLPKSGVSLEDSWTFYIDGLADQAAKTKHFGMTPVTGKGRPVHQIRTEYETKIQQKKITQQDFLDVGEAAKAEKMGEQIARIEGQLANLSGTYKLKHIDDIIENQITSPVQQDLAKSALVTMVDGKTNNSFYAKALDEARRTDLGMKGHAIRTTEEVSKGVNTAASAAVGIAKGMVYDSTNFYRSLVAHNTGYLRGIYDLVFNFGDTAKLAKQVKTLGVFSKTKNPLRDGFELMPKVLDVLFAPLQITQTASGAFNLFGAMGRLKMLRNRALKGRLNKADLSELREEFFLGDEQITNLGEANIRDLSRYAISNTEVAITAQRGARNIAAGSGGAVSTSLYKFSPYVLTASSHLWRNLKRRPLKAGTTAISAGLALSSYLKSKEDSTTQEGQFFNYIANPNRKEKSYDQNPAERLMDFLLVASGIDFYLNKAASSNPRNQNDPMSERIFTEDFFSRFVGAYGVATSLIQNVIKGTNIALKDGYLSPKAKKKLTAPIGALREMNKLNAEADEAKADIPDLTKALYEGRIDNSFLRDLDENQIKDFHEELSVNEGVTYGTSSPQFELALERYKFYRPRSKRETVVKKVWKMQAESQGKSYPRWMYDKVSSDENPREFFQELDKDGFIDKATFEYFKERGL